MMTEEKAAFLKEILEASDIPRKISPKNVLRFVDRMQPKTQFMRDYLTAWLSAETDAEGRAMTKVLTDTMTSEELKAFDRAFYDCLMNDLRSNQVVKKPVCEPE
jgi:hypothetical protein